MKEEAQPDIAEQARSMRAAGHGPRDIANVLNVHPAQVERWLATEHEDAAAAHARAWEQSNA